jgi:hypothetical protein
MGLQQTGGFETIGRSDMSPDERQFQVEGDGFEQRGFPAAIVPDEDHDARIERHLLGESYGRNVKRKGMLLIGINREGAKKGHSKSAYCNEGNKTFFSPSDFVVYLQPIKRLGTLPYRLILKAP